MRQRALLLTATILLSTVAMGVGASAVAIDRPAPTAVEGPTDPATAGPVAGTEAAADNGADDAADGPTPVTVPPDRRKNFTVNTSTLPASVGGTRVAADVGAATRNATVGTTLLFPASERTSAQYYFKEFTLRRVGEHGEIWVANDLSWPANDSRADPEVSEAQLDYLMEEFDDDIYPTESDLFREPQPRYGNQSALAATGQVPRNYYKTGNESRVAILVDNIRDESYYDPSYPIYIAGFYSQTIEDYTDRNVVTVDAANWDNRTGTPDSPWRPDNGSDASYGIEGTFAHEYQHLLHADQDPDESSWVNEGLSDFAEYAVGYGLPTSHVPSYEQLPSNSLIEWEDQGAINQLADYGAAFLFQLYGSERYGEAFVKAMFDDTNNSITSANHALDVVGSPENFTTFYQDFSTALVGDAGADGPPPYGFENAELEVNTSSDVINTRDREVASWGNAYETVDASGNTTVERIEVSGIDSVPTRWRTTQNPVGNDTVLASGADDLTDRFAIFEANLSDARSPTLGFDTYYDVEHGWDYGYVQVSTDGGETWTSLSNANTTDYVASPDSAYPPVVENRPGFTGDTNGEWTEQTFDLSAYAGEDVLIGFRYIGDWAVQGNSSELPGTGMYVRDVSVPGTNVSYDGSSIEPFRGIDEVRGEYVGYQYSVLGLDGTGELVDVKQYPVKTFATRESRTLTDLPTGENVSRLVLTITRASDQGEFGTVPYDYTVGYAGEGPTEPTEPTEPTDATNYQIDFVAGEPLDRLGGDYPLYAERNRLLRFAHGNTDEGITERGSAWANESIRDCVDYGHIGTNDDGAASVTFTVADGCGNVTLSLAAYEKPGAGFDASETQTLLDASTGSYGAGTHTLVVDLPDGEEDAE